MIWIFLFTSLFMIWLEYKIDERLINVVSVITIPYVVVILVNNLYAVKADFYEISNQTIAMEMLGLFSIFLGTVIVNHRRKILIGRTEKVYTTNEKFQYYNMNAMKIYCILIELLCYIRLVYFVRRHGFAYLSRDGVENFISGPIGHAYFSIYVLIPILFFYWIKNKKSISYLVTALAGTALSFFSFTKYHVIGLMILTYLFIALEDYHYIKKGALVLIGLVIAIFVANYVIGFINAKVIHSVNRNFYLNHLWKYVGGSIIHSNTIFQNGQNLHADFIEKILFCTLPLLNMLFKFIAGVEIQFPDIYIPYERVGANYLGETSNVVDFIGFMYPSKQGVAAIIFFAIIMCLFGMIAALLYNRAMRQENSFYITICVFFTFFLALAFFGEFASKSMTWELLVWSFILPKLFDRRIIIKI